ncbi:4'-phosphopantetheinyl transferase superfamily protein [Arthrobacter sp. N199823]|uniref:4'-phosphopantetheinyl transferase family protein n=1 Tax=Arthrobacter sp. N199823 TaxID=2058895 RepID=UPI0011B08FAA|nr:4'-phosphopantetheinyl transferase superfamily protein [Arthrobacter sp. N199823]
MSSQITVRAFDLAAVDLSLTGMLDAAEHARAAAIQNPATRRDFLAGRVVQRLMAAELLEATPQDLVAAYACPECGPNPVPSHGRPGYALRGKPAALSVSFSRSNGWGVAAMVTAAGVPLGVDVQHLAQVGFAGFDDVALSPTEKSTLAELAPEERERWRAVVWARKEALAKFTGQGLRTDPALIPAFPHAGAGEGAAARNVAAQVWELVPGELALPEDYAAAVACGGNL